MEATEVLRTEVNFSTEPDIFFPQLMFVLHLQRKPHYYLLHIMLPCIFITLAALLVCITAAFSIMSAYIIVIVIVSAV